MHDSLKKLRFSVVPLPIEGDRPVELARSISIHPLTYQELPYNPEYSLYAGRLNPEKLTNATPDEMYWKVRQQRIFPRDVSKVNKGRCSYQFACYHDGGIITDGVLLRVEDDKYWFAQADGDLFNWYKAHSEGLDVTISDPDVWVSQVAGPRSMELLERLIDGPMPQWRYFDWIEVTIAGEQVLISRTGFTNELGWEVYFRPQNNSEMLGDLILEEGSKMGMILTATPGNRCRRIEAGLLSAGQDFTSNTTPFVVGLGRFIDFEKGDFIGRKALMAAGKENQSWGIRVEGGTAVRGDTLEYQGQPIGRVTSSTWSPYQVCGVGIVLLNDADFSPGSVVDVKCSDGQLHQAQLCTLPMYDPQGEVVRGTNSTIPAGPEPWAGISAMTAIGSKTENA